MRERHVLGIASVELVVSYDSDLSHLEMKITKHELQVNEILCWWNEIYYEIKFYCTEWQSGAMIIIQ